jgi:hypothetical protein
MALASEAGGIKAREGANEEPRWRGKERECVRKEGNWE